jgi:hypothetical protein
MSEDWRLQRSPTLLAPDPKPPPLPPPLPQMAPLLPLPLSRSKRPIPTTVVMAGGRRMHLTSSSPPRARRCRAANGCGCTPRRRGVRVPQGFGALPVQRGRSVVGDGAVGAQPVGAAIAG